MAYFVYVDSDYDTALYYAFWPIYKLYRLTQCRYPSGNRHNLDRDPIPTNVGP